MRSAYDTAAHSERLALPAGVIRPASWWTARGRRAWSPWPRAGPTVRAGGRVVDNAGRDADGDDSKWRCGGAASPRIVRSTGRYKNGRALRYGFRRRPGTAWRTGGMTAGRAWRSPLKITLRRPASISDAHRARHIRRAPIALRVQPDARPHRQPGARGPAPRARTCRVRPSWPRERGWSAACSTPLRQRVPREHRHADGTSHALMSRPAGAAAVAGSLRGVRRSRPAMVLIGKAPAPHAVGTAGRGAAAGDVGLRTGSRTPPTPWRNAVASRTGTQQDGRTPQHRVAGTIPRSLPVLKYQGRGRGHEAAPAEAVGPPIPAQPSRAGRCPRR